MPQMPKIRYYIGVDVGKLGAVVVQNSANSNIVVKVTPLIGDQLNEQAFAQLFAPYYGKDCIVVMEDLHSIFGAGAKANFNFGGIFHFTRACCVCNEIPYVLVQPKAWQKEMFGGIRTLTKPGKTDPKTGKPKVKVDTKAMSILACKRLFPKIPLTNPDSRRSTKPLDGISDALLLSQYAKLRHP